MSKLQGQWKGTMSLQRVVIEAFKSVASTLSLQDTWLCDIALLQVLLNNFGLHGSLPEDENKALMQMNKCVAQAPEFQSINLEFPRNSTGYYRMKMTIRTEEGKRQMRHFYSFRNQQKRGPLQLLTFETAQKVYNNRASIRISKRKINYSSAVTTSTNEDNDENEEYNENTGSHETTNELVVDGPVDNNNTDTSSSMILPSQILSLSLNFWNSTNMYS